MYTESKMWCDVCTAYVEPAIIPVVRIISVMPCVMVPTTAVLPVMVMVFVLIPLVMVAVTMMSVMLIVGMPMAMFLITTVTIIVISVIVAPDITLPVMFSPVTGLVFQGMFGTTVCTGKTR